MKKYFLIFAAAAMTVCFAMSCSKDNGDKKSNEEEQNQPHGLADPVNYENCPFEVSRFVRNDDNEPIKRTLAADWTFEWDGNDYYVTLWDKNANSFITGEDDPSFIIKNIEGGDIFQPITTQSLTVKKWLVAKLTPKALGECILSFKHGQDSVLIKATVTRKEPYYLGYNSSTALMPDFFTINSALKLAWKKNVNGVLTNVECGADDIAFMVLDDNPDDDYIVIDKKASDDGKYYYFTVTKKNASSSFDQAVGLFGITIDGKTYSEFIRFSTYGKSSYEINYDVNNKD